MVEKWTGKQRLPIGLGMVVAGIVPMLFWTGLDKPVILRGLACFCLLFGLSGGVLFTLFGTDPLFIAAGYCLSFVLIILPQAPEITGLAAVLCLGGGVALMLWMNHILQKRKKEKQAKCSYRKGSAGQAKRYKAAKAGKKVSLSPKAAAVLTKMGYLQCGVFCCGTLSFILSILQLRQPVFLLALFALMLAAAWGMMQLMILPELQLLPSGKRYCAHPLRFDPVLQLTVGMGLAALVLLNAAGQISYGWEMLLIPGCFAIAAGICAFVRSEKNKKLRMGAAAMAVFYAMVVGGLGLMAANYVLPADHRDLQAQITDKYKTGGKTTSYHLKCDSPDGEIRLRVSRNRYDNQEVGDSINIRKYQGALFMTWCSLIDRTEK